jgi:hypothetical protein
MAASSTFILSSYVKTLRAKQTAKIGAPVGLPVASVSLPAIFLAVIASFRPTLANDVVESRKRGPGAD